jgi:hypothetical protein
MNLSRSRQKGVDEVPASTRRSGLRVDAATFVDVEQYLPGRRAARQITNGAPARHADSRRRQRSVLRAKREA